MKIQEGKTYKISNTLRARMKSFGISVPRLVTISKADRDGYIWSKDVDFNGLSGLRTSHGYCFASHIDSHHFEQVEPVDDIPRSLEELDGTIYLLDPHSHEQIGAIPAKENFEVRRRQKQNKEAFAEAAFRYWLASYG